MEMAEPVLKHRMALTFAARADGDSVEGVVGKLKSRIG
jgi:MoxR-like ATPase